MCGISGALDLAGRPIDPELVPRMNERLGHRGPDDRGLWEGDGVALGHTRLSLLDLDGGRQPMAGERGEVVVAFNGEIYNFASLRRELIARGHRFRTRSDTEVIPHAYQEWGLSSVERLAGMFAFALWDAPRRRLVLARDRLGVKPLYYARAGERLLFASELKALLVDGGIARRLDPEALHHYLGLLVPLAPRTLFEGVRALEPGSLLVIEDGRESHRRYWLPRILPDGALTEDEALDQLDSRLHETLRDQVVADVPVGAFLSGGVDSSLLVAYLARARRDPFPTFTVGFDQASHDESPIARETARRFRTAHHELRVAAQSTSYEMLTGILDHFDQPFGDSSAIPTWLVARETRGFVKTVISGDGGDELFGGYTAYRVAGLLAKLRSLPSLLRCGLLEVATLGARVPWEGTHQLARQLGKALAIARLSPSEALCALRSYFDEPEKRALYRPEHAARVAGLRTASHFPVEEGLDLPTALAASDLRHRLAGDMLCKVDMMSMAHGLEVRVPFLDERMVELALRLPLHLRVRGATTKFLLRRAAQKRLPRPVALRRKTGFEIPLRHAAGPAIDRLIDETIAAPSPKIAAIFRPEALAAYVTAFRSDHLPTEMSRYQLDQRVYALCALERWARVWEVSL